MTDEMKSAIDIAMEKLKKMEEKGEEEISLTEEQKQKIAEIRKEYDAKIAEKEIMMQSKMKELALEGDPEAIREQTGLLQNDLAEEKNRLQKERDKKIAGVKQKG